MFEIIYSCLIKYFKTKVLRKISIAIDDSDQSDYIVSHKISTKYDSHKFYHHV